MNKEQGTSKSRREQLFPALPGVSAVVLASVLSLNWPSIAQVVTAPPPGPDPSQASVPTSPSPPPGNQPGFLDAVGRWFGESKEKIDQSLKGTQEAIGELGVAATEAAKGTAGATQQAIGAAQQATDALIGIPAARVVSGRERCGAAANGAPDCAAAVATLCRAKGFATGRGLDVNSREKCPAWVWLSGRQPAPGQCKTETYVLRAVCQ